MERITNKQPNNEDQNYFMINKKQKNHKVKKNSTRNKNKLAKESLPITRRRKQKIVTPTLENNHVANNEKIEKNKEKNSVIFVVEEEEEEEEEDVKEMQLSPSVTIFGKRKLDSDRPVLTEKSRLAKRRKFDVPKKSERTSTKNQSNTNTNNKIQKENNYEEPVILENTTTTTVPPVNNFPEFKVPLPPHKQRKKHILCNNEVGELSDSDHSPEMIDTAEESSPSPDSTPPGINSNNSNSLKYSVGYMSYIGGRNENQDTFLLPGQCEGVPIFGVFDGHGPLGKQASQAAAKIMSTNLGYKFSMLVQQTAMKDELLKLQENNNSISSSSTLSSSLSSSSLCNNEYSEITNNKEKDKDKEKEKEKEKENFCNNKELKSNKEEEEEDNDNSEELTPKTKEQIERERQRRMIERYIGMSVVEAQKALLKGGRESGLEYGTTAVLGLMTPDRQGLVLANIGDSRAVLFRCRARTVQDTVMGAESRRTTRRAARMAESPLTTVLCTEDHRPEREDEMQRIIDESGGKGRIVVGRGSTLRIIPCTEDFSIQQIIQRKLGLAMTRSLGHVVLSNYGVTFRPDFYYTDLQVGDFLVLASDGVWDVMTIDDVMMLVGLYAAQDPQATTQMIVHEAEDRWRAKGTSSDNITAIVVHFHL